MEKLYKYVKNQYVKLNENIKSDEIANEYLLYCQKYRNSYLRTIYPPQKRIVVFGDIHGDYSLTILLFKNSGLIKESENGTYDWIGGDTFVVQVGDQIDKCRPMRGELCSYPNTTKCDEASDIKILEFFYEMSIKAEKYGGAVISLLGNHEIMNVMGEMSYVSYKGIKQFSDNTNKYVTGLENRRKMFSPGNQYAKLLGCTRLSAVIIGTNLFIHGGIVNDVLPKIGINSLGDFENLNRKIRNWLLGNIDGKYVENIINDTESIFWSRVLSVPKNELSHEKCENYVKNVMKILNIGHIIVGHTPQISPNSGGINSACDNKIWRVDTGSSTAFNKFSPNPENCSISHDTNRMPQCLEIINDKEFRKVLLI